MGEILFWLEAAISSALFVALGLAIMARRKSRAGRWAVRTTWCLLAALPWVLAVGMFGLYQGFVRGAEFPLVCSSISAGLVLVASVILIRRARRRTASEQLTAAAQWRLGRLSFAFAAAAMLTCLTFWNLDLSVRQEMASLRTEAGALALSLAPPPVPDSQNAALLYRQAWATLDSWDEAGNKWGSQVSEWLKPEKRPFNPGDPAMLAFLQKRQPVVELLRQAAERTSCNFGFQYNPPSIRMVLPDLAQIFPLTNLLCLSACVSAAHGRADEAMKDLNAASMLAERLPEEPMIITVLVGCATEGATSRSLEYVMNRGPLTAKDLDLLKMNRLFSFNRGFHRAVQMEQAFGMSVFTAPDPFREARTAATCSAGPHFTDVSSFGAIYRVFLWQGDVRSYLFVTQYYERTSLLPYSRARTDWESMEERLQSRRLGGAIARIFLAAYSRIPRMVATADAYHDLVLLAVAMQRYRLESGAFPEKLDRLSPDYLLTVPIDPFSGEPMRMAFRDDGLAIYSVGWDMKDDGGADMDYKTEKGDIRFLLKAERPTTQPATEPATTQSMRP